MLIVAGVLLCGCASNGGECCGDGLVIRRKQNDANHAEQQTQAKNTNNEKLDSLTQFPLPSGRCPRAKKKSVYDVHVDGLSGEKGSATVGPVANPSLAAIVGGNGVNCKEIPG